MIVIWSVDSTRQGLQAAACKVRITLPAAMSAVLKVYFAPNKVALLNVPVPAVVHKLPQALVTKPSRL